MTAPKHTGLTLIEAQQRLIDRVNQCHSGHRRRVTRGAARELRRFLASVGFPAHQHDAIVRDALDVAKLEETAGDE